MRAKSHTILIVDDVKKRRQHLKSMLLEREDAVMEAETAEEALEMVRQRPADLVITETELPTRSGQYLLQEVKRQHPETEVILTTHNACYQGIFDKSQLNLIPEISSCMDERVLENYNFINYYI